MPVDYSEMHPELAWRAYYFVEVMRYYGLPVRITEAFRSSERQKALWASGRTAAGPVLTHATAGKSKHERYPAEAFDFTFQSAGFSAPAAYWNFAGQVGEWLGLKWGGRFTRLLDRPHFEI